MPQKATNLSQLELSSIEMVVDTAHIESFEENDPKSLFNQMAKTPQHREKNLALFERNLSQKALTPRNAPPKTFR